MKRFKYLRERGLEWNALEILGLKTRMDLPTKKDGEADKEWIRELRKRHFIEQALTLDWSWAILVFAGPVWKNIENRNTRPAHNYRGRLWIHAGKKEGDALKQKTPIICDAVNSLIDAHPESWKAKFPSGTILGCVDLIACGIYDGSSWMLHDYKHHWLFERPRLLLTPVPARGMPGMWDVPAAVQAIPDMDLIRTDRIWIYQDE